MMRMVWFLLVWAKLLDNLLVFIRLYFGLCHQFCIIGFVDKDLLANRHEAVAWTDDGLQYIKYE